MEFIPGPPPESLPEVDATATEVAGETDSLKHRNGIPGLQAWRSQADQSENNVLLAFIMACWKWLTSPLPASTLDAALAPYLAPLYPLDPIRAAAWTAARPRRVLLAPIHVPWQPRSSPPLA